MSAKEFERLGPEWGQPAYQDSVDVMRELAELRRRFEAHPVSVIGEGGKRVDLSFERDEKGAYKDHHVVRAWQEWLETHE